MRGVQPHISLPFMMGTSSTVNAHIPYHTHPHYEIYYFRGGKANYLINDRIYVLEPGDLILMHGMTLHRAHVDQSEPYHRTTIHFDPFYFEKYIQPAYAANLLEPFQKLQNVRLQLQGEAKDEVEQLLQTLGELYDRHTAHAHQRFQARFADLMMVIGELCRQPLQEAPSFPSSKEKRVQAVISYIESHYRDDITLEDLQWDLHLSKFYLAKTFREVTGITIFQFLMQRRIYHAKLELIQAGGSITDIGYDAGFKHPSHFSRAFKAHTGLTPEQYRRRHGISATKG